MNTTPILSSRATARAQLSALLLALGIGVLQGASGCGRAESPTSIDSETHWLMHCDTDDDCGAGSCECGVCTATCSGDADCSLLGVAGVACVPQAGACGASGDGAGGAREPALAGSVCLLPCDGDDDCSAFGGDAVCENQHCVRPASSGGGGGGGGAGSNAGGAGGQVGIGGASGTSEAVLCDGSEDIRFVWTTSGGFVDSYYAFYGSRGFGFLAIDGQCRFWRGTANDGIVSSGALSSDDAARLASALGYERFPELPSYDDPESCPDAGASRIWTPYSTLSCVCGCGEGTGGEPWLPALRFMRDPRLDDLLATNATPASGPARLALIGYPDRIPESYVLPWPLSRAPADNELYVSVGDPPLIEASSGVEITDASELFALRAARATYAVRFPGSDYTPLELVVADNDQTAQLHMLLRDELPENVEAALERPLF